jgi:hypothetical protein
MAFKMQTAGVEKNEDKNSGPTAGLAQDAVIDASVGVALHPSQAALVMDDLLSLLPTLFKMFDRSDEVDLRVNETLSKYFASARIENTESEKKFIDSYVKLDNKVRTPPPAASAGERSEQEKGAGRA